MRQDQQDGVIDQNGNGTPSTASRIKPAAVENAFPTPPRRDGTQTPNSVRSQRKSSGPARMLGFGKSSPAPKEHKSVEALRTDVSRGNSNGLSSTSDMEQLWSRKEVSKKNSQFFDQAFSLREPYHSAKERVARDSMIVSEIRLNCSLENSQQFLNDFLMTMSEIYHRPTNNVMIVATTAAHIMVGGSTEPAYLLTITALASEIASIKNMRTTIIVQDFLSDSLEIPANRGVIKFQAIKEDDFATNGVTVQQEIEKLEQKAAEEKRGISLRSRQSNRTSKKSGLPSMSETPGDLEQSRSDTPILAQKLEIEQEEDVQPLPSIASTSRKLKGRKSIMSFFKRS